MTQKYAHVLAVDDDLIFHQVIKAFFGKIGIDRVTLVEDGKQAIAALAANADVDLIISDIHMPGTDGVELLEHLHVTGCQTPVVVVSSADEVMLQSTTVLARVQGLNLLGTVKKPIKTDAFVELLGLKLDADQSA